MDNKQIDNKQQIELLIFAKEPKPYQVKTRLIPSIGVHKATQVASLLLKETLEMARRFRVVLEKTNIQAQVTLVGAPDVANDFWLSLSKQYGFRLVQQVDGDLGQRLQHAVNQGLENNHHVLCIGTDCPGLTEHHLYNASLALQKNQCVLQGATDGGYVLLGMTTQIDELFENIPWSTAVVFSTSIDRLNKKKISYEILFPELTDIDTIEDFRFLEASPEEHLETLANSF